MTKCGLERQELGRWAGLSRKASLGAQVGSGWADCGLQACVGDCSSAVAVQSSGAS